MFYFVTSGYEVIKHIPTPPISHIGPKGGGPEIDSPALSYGYPRHAVGCCWAYVVRTHDYLHTFAMSNNESTTSLRESRSSIGRGSTSRVWGLGSSYAPCAGKGKAPTDVNLQVKTARNVSETSPCTNLPTHCETCPGDHFVWKYSLQEHINLYHGGIEGMSVGGGDTLKVSLVISPDKRSTVLALVS